MIQSALLWRSGTINHSLVKICDRVIALAWVSCLATFSTKAHFVTDKSLRVYLNIMPVLLLNLSLLSEEFHIKTLFSFAKFSRKWRRERKYPRLEHPLILFLNEIKCTQIYFRGAVSQISHSINMYASQCKINVIQIDIWRLLYCGI